MNIVLKFDYYCNTIYVPDGYIKSIKDVQRQFFEWLYEQPTCIVQNNKPIAISYNEKDFLKYINDVVLADSREKAYLLSCEKKINKKTPVLKF